MTEAGAAAAPTGADEGGSSQYVFVFQVKRTEADIEGSFLTKSGTLGAAAARAETDFALTHSPTSVSELVTESLTTVRIPIAEAMMKMVPSDVHKSVAAKTTEKAGPTIVLSGRARLNMTASRVAASINGTLVGTMSGQGSVLLRDLFSDVQPLSSLISNGHIKTSEMQQLGQLLKKNTNSEASANDYRELADAMSLSIKARVDVPFELIPVKYSNWGTHQAVMAVYDARVVRLSTSGAPGESNVGTIIWYDDPAHDAAILRVEPIMQHIYDSSWEMTEKLVFEPVTNLTKSVMRVPVGYNGSGYALSAAVNDTPVSFDAPTLEAILAACLAAELSPSQCAECTDALATPSVEASMECAPSIANALSAFSAYTMPYRVDGTPVVTPTGIKMVQSESWRAEASRSIMHADDCDGSACNAVAIIRFAEHLLRTTPADVMARDFKTLRAVANSIGAHYVYGTTVLAANAGNAAAVNEQAKTLAGHAIAMALPKPSFLVALDRGALSSIAGVPLEVRGEVTEARFDALYPRDLVDRMPEAEQKYFASFETLKANRFALPDYGLQPLSMEGTTYASSRMYTHDADERSKRGEWYAMDKKVAASLSPNITRTHKALDAGERSGHHAFYESQVEIGVSMQHNLFTSAVLRKHGQASAQYRFARSEMNAAGASPKQLATGDYAAVPLWRADDALGATIDLANAEAAANVMPMRAGPHQLDAAEVDNLRQSVAVLKTLQQHLMDNKLGPIEKTGANAPTSHETHHVVSFASLVQNPKAIEAFVETITRAGGVTGTVSGLREKEDVLPGVAVGGDRAQLGRFVTVSLHVPVA